MKRVVIENPIINSPFDEPQRHFRFDDDGITDEIIGKRRRSAYFVPIAQPRKKGKTKQLVFDTEWTQPRIEENEMVNQIRQRVAAWRGRGYPSTTRISQRLLGHWKGEDRSRRLVFCQSEALETFIYVAEAARHGGDGWISGGFFVLEPEVLDYIADDETIWERGPLQRIAREGQLMAYAHEGFWQCMDHMRDKILLENMWERGAAPWKVWK